MYVKKELHTIRLPLMDRLLFKKSLFVGLLFYEHFASLSYVYA